MKRYERNTQVPLEEEFAEWLRSRKLLTQRTVQRHLSALRRVLSQRDLKDFLFVTLIDSRERQAQRLYKEFLCEYFAHILLPLLRERSSSTPFPEGPPQQHGESPHERTR